LTLPGIATILRSRLGDRGAWIPTRVAPDWLVRPAVRFVAELETLAGLLGPPKLVSAAKVTNMLGWQPRSTADTLTDTAESLLGRRLVVR
jgi:hypothetical protein